MSKENEKEVNVQSDKKSEKKIIKKILIILAILFIGFIIISLLPFLYFVGVILYSRFIDVPSKPEVKHGEFPFELVYEYKGEQITIKDTIVCDYEGNSWSLDGGSSRDWTCEFGKDDEYGQYYIDKENVPGLYIEVPEAADYYMGDKEVSGEDTHPLIMYIDESTGTFYQEKDKVDVVDIKIIEWKPSKPLEGNIK
jgi:hypothetical protein